MPLFAILFSSVFVQITAYFTAIIGKKFALYAAALTSITILTAGLLGIFMTAASAIRVTLPVAYSTLTAFLPSNLGLCLSTYAAAAIAKWVYDWNTTLILNSTS